MSLERSLPTLRVPPVLHSQQRYAILSETGATYCGGIVRFDRNGSGFAPGPCPMKAWAQQWTEQTSNLEV